MYYYFYLVERTEALNCYSGLGFTEESITSIVSCPPNNGAIVYSCVVSKSLIFLCMLVFIHLKKRIKIISEKKTTKQIINGQANITKGCTASCISGTTSSCCSGDLCNAPVTTLPLVCYTCTNCGANEIGTAQACPTIGLYMCYVNKLKIKNLVYK